MDYMEIFLKCIEGDIDTSKASELIRQQADTLLLSGKVKEYEKAVLCLTYFIRYRQYNTGKINGSFYGVKKDFHNYICIFAKRTS